MSVIVIYTHTGKTLQRLVGDYRTSIRENCVIITDKNKKELMLSPAKNLIIIEKEDGFNVSENLTYKKESESES